jgi:hypothetical protein
MKFKKSELHIRPQQEIRNSIGLKIDASVGDISLSYDQDNWQKHNEDGPIYWLESKK